jgi:hypothetical protein
MVSSFIQDIAGIRTVIPSNCCLNFMMCICQLLKKQTNSHLNCLPIGPNTLQDFNEIDRYLLDPSYVLSYLKDIEDIRNGESSGE